MFSATVSGKDISLPSIQEQEKRGENIADFGWFSREELLKIPEQDCMALYVFRAIHDLDSILDNTPIKIVDITK